MITNSDIWLYPFNDICEQLIDLLNEQENIVYILTRHEHDLSSPWIDSGMNGYDSFIFKSIYIFYV